ncbi:MAG: hypothetical protein M1383_05540 [Patescibacteria group bacterium]|nr:hypothetical protein [Patescibacteria group bacterium]
MNKKAIAILGAIFILIVGTLGFLVYTKYAGNKSATNNTQATSNNTIQPNGNAGTDSTGDNSGNNNGNNSDINGSNTGSPFVKLTDEQVVSPALFYDGTGVTYFDKQGQLYQANFDESGSQLQLTRKRTLNVPLKSGIDKILWPSQGDDFIAESVGSSENKTWSLYDANAGVYKDLPSQVESLDWMPEGDKILFIWLDNGKATLNIGNPDTTGWKEISEMWEQDDEIKISPDGQSILYYRTGNTGVNNSIVMTTPDGKLWQDMVKAGYNFGVLWSPDSKKFLFNKRDRVTLQDQLWSYDIMTGETRNLGLFTTVDKAVWSKDGNTIYAAVPMSGTAGADSFSTDEFIKFDTTTSEKKEYFSDSTSMDGDNLFLSANEDKLFFRNAQDGGLYYLDLSK